jgi:hypothetical protein
MGVDIDETRGHVQPGRVDDAPSLFSRDRSHRDDAIADQAEVGGE